jgi:hypothetical protein
MLFAYNFNSHLLCTTTFIIRRFFLIFLLSSFNYRRRLLNRHWLPLSRSSSITFIIISLSYISHTEKFPSFLHKIIMNSIEYFYLLTKISPDWTLCGIN